MLGAESELACRAQHALRFEAAQFGWLYRHIGWEFRTDRGHCDGKSRANIRRAADDLQPVLSVGRHLAHRELLGIRMAATGEDLAHDDAGERRRHGRDRFDLEADLRQLPCKHLWRHLNRDEVLQPVIGDFHGNCFKNCRSFSKNRRRSSTP